MRQPVELPYQLALPPPAPPRPEETPHRAQGGNDPLARNARYELRVYQTGGFIGLPEGKETYLTHGFGYYFRTQLNVIAIIRALGDDQQEHAR